MSDDATRRMLLDKRVAERNIKRGTLTRQEYDAHMASLPDSAENAVEVGVRLYDDPSAPEDETDLASDADEGEEDETDSNG